MSLIPTNFKPNTIRNVIIALMAEFRNIAVEVIQPGTTEILKTIDPVPLQLGHMEKYHILNLRDHPDEDKRYYEKLPKMALTWSSLTYNGERARGVEDATVFYDKNLKLNDAEEFIESMNPAPYDLGFELELRTQSLGQFTQILENILPYFNPHRYLSVKEFSFLNVERDLKLRLESVSQDFLIEQTEENRRYINGTLSLMVEAVLYRPLTDIGIIKEIRSKYYVGAEEDFGLTVSASSGYNTSGWDSSAAFPTSAYDFSGTSFTTSGQEFEYYTSGTVDGW